MGYIADIGVPIIKDDDIKAIKIRREIIEELEQIGGENIGSGCGAGYCDVQMYFDRFKEASSKGCVAKVLHKHNVDFELDEPTSAYFAFYEEE